MDLDHTQIFPGRFGEIALPRFAAANAAIMGMLNGRMAIPDNPTGLGDGPQSQEIPGLKASLQAVLQRGLDHVRLRWALLSAEARLAAGQLAGLALAAVIMLVGSGLAYVAGWVALILWVGRRWMEGDVVVPLAVAAALHAAAAVAAGWWLKTRAAVKPIFPATRAEFAEDQKWLNHPNP
ncbi:MAG: hypothetical protein ACKV19_07465 [Verrucomicrobiales bacterium]